MLYGKIISVDSQTQRAQVEQDLNKRVFDFPFDVWEDELSDLKKGIEVEFIVESKLVTKIHVKPKPIDPDEIPVTKPAKVCIEEYFAHENEILSAYKDFVSGHLSLDFIRMRRFLLTAYNDLCAMDANIENDVLKKLKREIIYLSKEYEGYYKKTQYALNYAFEMIFLARQVEYNKTVTHIDEIQSSLANAQAQTNALSGTLAAEEKNLGKREDRGSKEFAEAEKEVKQMRKRYVDLLNFIGNQKDALVTENARLKRFKEEHFEAFSKVYTPMTQDIKTRFIALLDTKAYDFDTTLWSRAKYSQAVKQFFRNSRIEGSFSSKTFLRYFLRGLDKSKLSARSKELFDLLHYLETTNRKSLLIVRETMVNILKYRQVIEKIDSSLLITMNNDPIDALKSLMQTPQDIIVIDEKIGNVTALGFIKTYKEMPKANPKTVFCVIVHELPASEIISKGKFMGVEFVPEQNMDMLYDCIRMAL
ncbi:hypothetical protein LS71_001470 [Helicobacter jaachi]|uniref:Response regulatory domain-containing protein n=1 Tax=Helicobacter jaachi TaxID=1677920 RepID=A0A4U8TDR8_9HELI|nr:hypothetical protein [Helicobacter jaachi]TLD97448.1 hypothetical protein LS71_001470 [Helicobacter jaachi]